MPYRSTPPPNTDLSLVAHGMMEAIIRGDLFLAQGVFHPDATITGQQDGILVRFDVKSYMDFCGRLRLPRRNVADRYRVLLCEAEGPIAILKLHEVYPDGDLVSYMTLSKLNGRWLINNRTLYGSHRAARTSPTDRTGDAARPAFDPRPAMAEVAARAFTPTTIRG